MEHYNNVRLNSATGYITPKDVLAGRQPEIHAERDRKLEAARQQRPPPASRVKSKRPDAAIPPLTACPAELVRYLTNANCFAGDEP